MVRKRVRPVSQDLAAPAPRNERKWQEWTRSAEKQMTISKEDDIIPTHVAEYDETIPPSGQLPPIKSPFEKRGRCVIYRAKEQDTSPSSQRSRDQHLTGKVIEEDEQGDKEIKGSSHIDFVPNGEVADLGGAAFVTPVGTVQGSLGYTGEEDEDDSQDSNTFEDTMSRAPSGMLAAPTTHDVVWTSGETGSPQTPHDFTPVIIEVKLPSVEAAQTKKSSQDHVGSPRGSDWPEPASTQLLRSTGVEGVERSQSHRSQDETQDEHQQELEGYSTMIGDKGHHNVTDSTVCDHKRQPESSSSSTSPSTSSNLPSPRVSARAASFRSKTSTPPRSPTVSTPSEWDTPPTLRELLGL